MNPKAQFRFFAIAIVVSLILIPGLGCSSGPETFTVTGPTMGTVYTVKIVGVPMSSEDKARVQDKIEEVLDETNRLMSTYLPDSELSRFNASRTTEPFPISAKTAHVFTIAREVSEASAGAFDVTVGPLVNAWGFGPEGRPSTWPTEEEIVSLRNQTGYALLELDSAGPTLRKKIPELYCDLSAIAKGFGVDEVADALALLGHENYMVEIGGEVRTKGQNAERKPWQIAIEKPDATSRTLQRILPLSGRAMATSGDYRNFVEKDGKRVSHTIDPRTGKPVEHGLASVSVIAQTCAEADAWATALMVLGPNDGYTLASERELAALFITRETDIFIEKATPAFEALFPTR